MAKKVHIQTNEQSKAQPKKLIKKKKKSKAKKKDKKDTQTVKESSLNISSQTDDRVKQETVHPVISEKEPEQTETIEQETVSVVDDGKIECSPCKMASINKSLKLEYIKAGSASCLLIIGMIAYIKKKDMPLFVDIIMTIIAYFLLQVSIKIFELNKLKSKLVVKVE